MADTGRESYRIERLYHYQVYRGQGPGPSRETSLQEKGGFNHAITAKYQLFYLGQSRRRGLAFVNWIKFAQRALQEVPPGVK